MNLQRKTELEIENIQNPDTITIKLNISIDKFKGDPTLYSELLTNLVTRYNQKYDNICSCYDKSSILKSVLVEQLDIFKNLDNYTSRVSFLETECLNLNSKTSKLIDLKSHNLNDIRDEIMFVLDKHINPNSNPKSNVIESNPKTRNIVTNAISNSNFVNTGKFCYPSNDIIGTTLDYKTVDKISELIPENMEVLLKNVVKEINGSARGLSDFVALFHKYSKEIEAYKKIVYFQRKGCHFLKKIL